MSIKVQKRGRSSLTTYIPSGRRWIGTIFSFASLKHSSSKIFLKKRDSFANITELTWRSSMSPAISCPSLITDPAITATVTKPNIPKSHHVKNMNSWRMHRPNIHPSCEIHVHLKDVQIPCMEDESPLIQAAVKEIFSIGLDSRCSSSVSSHFLESFCFGSRFFNKENNWHCNVTEGVGKKYLLRVHLNSRNNSNNP